MGGPAVVASLMAFAAGLLSQRAGLVLAGSVISTPFCLYVSVYPGSRAFGLAVLGLNFLSAWASRRGRPVVAGALPRRPPWQRRGEAERRLAPEHRARAGRRDYAIPARFQRFGPFSMPEPFYNG
jgi:hypothetical protein